MTSGGNTSRCRSGSRAPKNVGPSRIPASTSPITRGWPMLDGEHADEAGDEHHDRDRDEEGGEQVPELAGLLRRRPSRSAARPRAAASRVIVRVISRFDAAPTSPASSPSAQVACPSACRRRRRRARPRRRCPRARARLLSPISSILPPRQAERGTSLYSPVDRAGRRGLLGARVRRLARELGLQRLAAERARDGAVADGAPAAAACRPSRQLDVAGQAGRS